MPNPHRNRQDTPFGFTLIELIVVIAVMSVLAGTVAPLVTATQEAEKVVTAQAELEAIADALAEHYFDTGSFPAALTTAGFYGKYIQPGVDDSRLKDHWGAQGYYIVQRSFNPDVMRVHSIGTNASDDGWASEAYRVEILGSGPGDARTKQRMRIIASVLAEFLDGGGALTGTWTTDLAAMGLGTEYQTDGYGTDFDLDSATFVLRSAGADRSLNTADDVIL